MLARINGGNSGIMEYLESGIKQGRTKTRDELDERLVLHGNLPFTDNLINKIENKGQERYLHITLSFKEDSIDENTLKDITKDYIDDLFFAYQEEEFNYYAEAHIPKIKEYLDKKTNETIERKPHIHLIIPKINLVTNNSLNPCINCKKDVKFFEAIQENINQKYNLQSPKDNVRDKIIDKSDILSRIKGDSFQEETKNFKQFITSKIEDKTIKSKEELINFLSSKGELKINNLNQNNEYFSIKLQGKDKFFHLNNSIFDIKHNHQNDIKNDNKLKIMKNLQDWKNQRSKEIKYIDIGNQNTRKKYYSEEDRAVKKVFLNQKEKSFYEKKEFNNITIISKKSIYKIDNLQKSTQVQNNQLNPSTKPTTDIKIIKDDIKVDYFVHFLKENHDLKESFKINEKDNRIQVNNRNYNVSDFLTKHLKYNWNESKNILENCYQKQQENFNQKQQLETPNQKKDKGMEL